MAKTPKPHYIIIGAGQAGIAAAESIRKTDEKTPITLIDSDPDAYYYRAAMKFHIKGHIPEEALKGRKANFLKTNKIDFITHNVEQITYDPVDPMNNVVTIAKNKPIIYTKLILATGANAAIPPIKGSQLLGVHPMRSLEDTRNILEIAQNGIVKKCIVLGTGVLGTELAEALHERGVAVEMFSKDPYLVPRMLDKPMAELVAAFFTQRNIPVHFNTGLQEILDDGTGKVKAVVTEKGETIACDGVFICTGIRRNLDLAKALNLKINQGIVVTEFLQTSVDIIYAAGDVVEVYDPESKQHRLVELWGPAGEMGRIAGMNVTGAQTPFRFGALHAYTTFFTNACHVIGMANPSDPAKYKIVVKNTQGAFGPVYLKLVFEKDLLVGAAILGEPKDPMLLKFIIQEKRPLPPLITPEMLLDDEFDYELILY